MRGAGAFAVASLLVLAAACSPGGPASAPPRPSPTPGAAASTAPPVVYAAVGASETTGIGAQDPLRESWPARLYRTALPNAVFYDLGIPAETTQAALTGELPEALSVQPTLATVWLNVDDLVAGVSSADYEARLGQLVHALRRGGATRVLVANTPYLDRLPLYLGCRAGTQHCPFAGSVPDPPALDAAVDGYNAATARVAQREGATLVDLHAAGEVPDAHPDWVSSDGFHPSTAGYAAIAAMFASALSG